MQKDGYEAKGTVNGHLDTITNFNDKETLYLPRFIFWRQQPTTELIPKQYSKPLWRLKLNDVHKFTWDKKEKKKKQIVPKNNRNDFYTYNSQSHKLHKFKKKINETKSPL